MTVTEFAKKKGLSVQRIRALLGQGRIKGAKKAPNGYDWIIAKNARITKPVRIFK